MNPNKGKLSIMTVWCMTFFMFLALAAPVAAQTVKRVTLSFVNEKASSALHKVEKQTGKKIQYNYDDVKFKVTVNVSGKTAEQAVEAIIKGHPLQVISKEDYIVIVKDSNIPNQKWESTNDRLQGLVVDEKGDPVIGAIIRDRNNKQNTVSDADGRFSLKASDHITLDVSYIGMKNTNWSGKRGDFAMILMQDASLNLQDVVVTGYQQLDRRNLTSSVVSKDMSELMRGGVTDVSKLLEGQIPDLIATNTSGEINATNKIRIRGTSTLIGNREPL